MAESGWDWKPRDSRRGGLLYQSGNWGDLLKLLWLTELLNWKHEIADGAKIAYFDPFAGATQYPMDAATAGRMAREPFPTLEYLAADFLTRGMWPSSASAAMCLASGDVAVFDADPERRDSWRSAGRAAVCDGESGWAILAGREPETNAVWLVDPYDFLAEWRDYLDIVLDKARTATVLLYLYNRSARSEEAFRNYRAFRNAVRDRRGDGGAQFGRVAADPFLPRSHHEVMLFPSGPDAGRGEFAELVRRLEERTVEVTAALGRAAVFGV